MNIKFDEVKAIADDPQAAVDATDTADAAANVEMEIPDGDHGAEEPETIR